MSDIGEDVGQCVLGTDSSSAKSITERRGAGRARCCGLKNVWILSRRAQYRRYWA